VNIVGKISMKATIFFTPHLNQRSSKEVMAFQSVRKHNFKNFSTPNLRILGQNDI
jgi:hypothetical protein